MINKGPLERELLPCPFCGDKAISIFPGSASCNNRHCEFRYMELPTKAWNTRAALASAEQAEPVEKSLVDQMVDRFLSWKLPKDFGPDAGISFKPTLPDDYETRWWPIGTNLFTAEQARTMFEYALAGVMQVPSTVSNTEWEKLKDPNVLHVNLLRGFPARLSKEQILHLLGEHGRAELSNAAVVDELRKAATVRLDSQEVTLCHSKAVLAQRHDGKDPSFTTLLARQFQEALSRKILALIPPEAEQVKP